MQATENNGNVNNAVNNIKVESREEYEFGVEVPQFMSMFINSVYSSKDLFLREAISNASDALTKFFDQKAFFDKDGYTTDMYSDLKIEIIPDKDNKTLIIKDNGIGMTKDDLKNYLGNIASSGTAKFKELTVQKGIYQNVDDLIGQFGLGFYSLFLVAKHVDVVTKNPRDHAYLWSSDGECGYSIKDYDYDGNHGTTIYLRLEDGEDAFLNSNKLMELVKKHSMYIKYPIGVETEVEQKKETTGNAVVEEVNDKEGTVNDKEKTVKKFTKEMKIVNSRIQVWKKKVADVPEEDLKKFYKQISGDYDDYMAVESFHYEGVVELKILLFIPKKQRMNLFEKQSEKAKNFKIYNNNVFIADELSREIVPEWMGFVYGAIISPDLSLNISREFLQGQAALKILKAKLPKCINQMIKKKSTTDKEQFKRFTNEFSKNIKLAVKDVGESLQNTYANFLKYPTNQSKDHISLGEYCNQLAATEKQILYLTGLSQKDVETSIYLDGYKDRHVLLMSDPIDEIMLQSFKKYNDLPFQSISAEGVLNKKGCEETQEENEEFKTFAEKIQEILKEQVEKVVISKRFKDIPASILTTKFSCSSTFESILRANATAENNMMVQMMLNSKNIFEINPDNAFVQEIKDEFDNGNMDKVTEYIKFLHQAISVGCGFALDNKTDFIRTMFKIVGTK